jgi:predicted 3-demethylubiquinone-9 3-methyltransferase (glyoxalase superfamily)
MGDLTYRFKRGGFQAIIDREGVFRYTLRWAGRKAERSKMQINLQKITPCLWFDNQAEEAANFYTSIFKNSKIGRIARYGKEGYEIHGRSEGTVMTVEFEIDGQAFTALNGGPIFKFNEAISFQVRCETQEEVDYYWEKLSEGGDKKAQQCGWLKDKYGMSWQVIPKVLSELLGDPDSEKSQRAMKAMLQMKKIDIGKIKRAYDGLSIS